MSRRKKSPSAQRNTAKWLEKQRAHNAEARAVVADQLRRDRLVYEYELRQRGEL